MWLPVYATLVDFLLAVALFALCCYSFNPCHGNITVTLETIAVDVYSCELPTRLISAAVMYKPPLYFRSLAPTTFITAEFHHAPDSIKPGITIEIVLKFSSAK